MELLLLCLFAARRTIAALLLLAGFLFILPPPACAEAALLAEHEAAERWEAAAVEASLAQDHEAGPPCPVCKQRALLQNRHVIFCGCGGVRLETQHEGFTLDVSCALVCPCCASTSDGT